MNVVGATLVVVLFALLIHLTRLVDRSRDVLEIARRTSQLIRDNTVADEVKEKQTQRNALAMFRLLGVLAVGTALALVLPLALVWLADRLGLVSFDGVTAMLMTWEFIVAGTLVGIATYFAAVKWLTPNS